MTGTICTVCLGEFTPERPATRVTNFGGAETTVHESCVRLFCKDCGEYGWRARPDGTRECGSCAGTEFFAVTARRPIGTAVMDDEVYRFGRRVRAEDL